MKRAEYDSFKKNHNETADKIEDDKRPAYTMGSDDVLANFKRVGHAAGIPASKVALVYFLKHVDSISAYVKDREAVSQSEPMMGRFADARNYLTLMAACLAEERDREFLIGE
jgi:hypothetical protein